MNQIYPEPTVVALVLNNQNKILLVKSHKWINNRYSVPGGHVEIGESLSTAIIREVKEETGLEILPKRLFMIQECIKSDELYIYFITKFCRNLIIVYHYKGCR